MRCRPSTKAGRVDAEMGFALRTTLGHKSSCGRAFTSALQTIFGNAFDDLKQLKYHVVFS